MSSKQVNPLISVIIPNYNAASIVKETIDSVLNQTHQNLELIVVDDGSTDNVLEVLRGIEDPRLIIIESTNQGVCSARNIGMTAAKGDYFAFLDNDDLWHPKKLEAQLQAILNKPGAEASYSWTKPFMGDKIFAHKHYYKEGFVYDDMLEENFVAHGSNLLMSRKAVEAVGPFDQSIALVGDWDYALRVAEKFQMAVDPNPHIFYRLSSSSLSRNLAELERQSIALLEKALPLSSLDHKHIMSRNYIFLVSICFSRATSLKDVAAAIELLSKAFKKDPAIFATYPFALKNLLKVLQVSVRVMLKKELSSFLKPTKASRSLKLNPAN